MRKNVMMLNRYMYREISLSDLCLDSGALLQKTLHSFKKISSETKRKI